MAHHVTTMLLLRLAVLLRVIILSPVQTQIPLTNATLCGFQSYLIDHERWLFPVVSFIAGVLLTMTFAYIVRRNPIALRLFDVPSASRGPTLDVDSSHPAIVMRYRSQRTQTPRDMILSALDTLQPRGSRRSTSRSLAADPSSSGWPRNPRSRRGNYLPAGYKPPARATPSVSWDDDYEPSRPLSFDFPQPENWDDDQSATTNLWNVF